MIPLMLSAVVMFTTVGCGGPELVEQLDESKTTLKVYNYSGGVGTGWLTPIKERFEQKFANYEFEPGKKGVQIMPDETKTDASLQTIQQNENHVFFAEWVDAVSLIGNDNTLNIHDVMTTPLNEFLLDETGKPVTDDTATIESKLYEESKDFYTFRDEQYYGLPHYSHFPAIIYNHQLFEDKGLFFADAPLDDGTIEGNFTSSSNPKKSCGPDGKIGTEDDGLPATWDEMFLLYDRMIQRKVIPFVWNGEGAKGYTKYFLSNAYLNLVGKDVARYNYDYNSGDNTINIITKFNADGTYETGTAKISSEADKKFLHSELEKFYALEAFDKMLDNSNYYTKNCKDGLGSHLDAQYDFILSAGEGQPIGMLLEGSYWYNEAEDAGHIDAAIYSQEDFEDLNDFRIMYMPHQYNGRASDIKGKDMGKFVLADQSDSFACINKTIEGNEGLVKCAKMFLAFCYTQESLEDFTAISDTVRFMHYDVDTSKLSDYGKHIWNIVKEADVLLPYSRHKGYLEDKRKFTMHIEGTFFEYNADRPYDLLRGGTKTVVDYFKNYMAQDNK